MINLNKTIAFLFNINYEIIIMEYINNLKVILYTVPINYFNNNLSLVNSFTLIRILLP